MSDDLIERLRSAVGDARLVKLCRDAADALAAVEQERDHWHRVAMQAAEQERDAARVWHEKAHTFLEERNAYRARLAKVEQERDAARARIERLERGLTPRRWTREMNDAWHRSIPDVEQAFAGLRSVLFPDQEGDGRDPVVVEAREYFAALREMNAAAIAVEIDYTNWRGERSKRVILPSGMVFDSSEYHPQPQWLVRAWDPDKQSYRDFAMDSIHAWTPLSRLALNRSGEQP